MQVKRILMVSSGSLDRSGVPSVIMTIVRRLSDEFCFDLLLSTESSLPGPLEEEFKSYGGSIFHVRKTRCRLRPADRLAEIIRPLQLYFETLKLLKGREYQAVHCHNEFDMAGPLAAAYKAGVPVRIAETHKTWERSGGPLTRIYRAFCRKAILGNATLCLGCSEQAGDAFFGRDAGAGTVYAPYDEERFIYDGSQPSPGSMDIAQVGYFCSNKNQIFTVEVFSRIAAASESARLFLTGSDQDPYAEELKKTIIEKGLEKRVFLLPPDTDIPALMRNCNLLLLPSGSEGFGIVLIEAQACGLSCYASDTVPRGTDMGGVCFLPLSDGPDVWADRILKERRFEHKEHYDCGRFSAAEFAERFRAAYRH